MPTGIKTARTVMPNCMSRIACTRPCDCRHSRMVSSSFSPPPFETPPLASAPDATFVAAPADGVLPEGFFATTNLPTYVRHAGAWKLPHEPRMDGALVLDAAGAIWVREGRRVRAGDLVAVGREEDGSRG